MPEIKYLNWINVGYGDISIKGYYPYYSFNTLYESLHHGFTFSLTWFNAKSWTNSNLSFAFNEDIIAYLKQPAKCLSLMKNNAYENEQNTQSLLFPCKIYNLGASGTDFLFCVFVCPGGNSKEIFMTHQTL